MKIKFLHPVPKMAYFPGDVADFDEQRGSKLVAQGSAVIIPETEGEEEINRLPDELPFRELLFDNGFETIDDVINAGKSVTDIKGIGNRSYLKILEFIETDKILNNE